MKIQTFRQLVREEIKKTLHEAMVDIPDRYVKVIHLGGKHYALEYSNPESEFTLDQIQKIADSLNKTFTRLSKDLQVTRREPGVLIHIRFEDIAIGIHFDSKLDEDGMAATLDEKDFVTRD